MFGNPLKGAIERLQNINNNDPCRFIDDLKILLLAHDNKMKIYNLNSICWTGILIKLANELELEGRRGILRRVLRLLRVSSNLDLEILPLILLNSIRKVKLLLLLLFKNTLNINCTLYTLDYQFI